MQVEEPQHAGLAAGAALADPQQVRPTNRPALGAADGGDPCRSHGRHHGLRTPRITDMPPILNHGATVSGHAGAAVLIGRGDEEQ